MLVQAGAKFYQLYVKRDHCIKELRKGLSTLRYLGAAAAFLGVCGYFLELYGAGLKTMFLGPFFFLCFLDTDRTLSLAVESMIRSSSLMMICLLVTMSTALLWFVLMNKVIRIEQTAAVLLEE